MTRSARGRERDEPSARAGSWPGAAPQPLRPRVFCITSRHTGATGRGSESWGCACATGGGGAKPSCCTHLRRGLCFVTSMSVGDWVGRSTPAIDHQVSKGSGDPACRRGARAPPLPHHVHMGLCMLGIPDASSALIPKCAFDLHLPSSAPTAASCSAAAHAHQRCLKVSAQAMPTQVLGRVRCPAAIWMFVPAEHGFAATIQ